MARKKRTAQKLCELPNKSAKTASYWAKPSQPGEPLRDVQLKELIEKVLQWGCSCDLLNNYGCGHQAIITAIEEFFRPSAPSPQPTYEEAKLHIGWGWSGFTIKDEDSLKFVFNRMRDAMQKCRDVTPSGSAGPEPKCNFCGFNLVVPNPKCIKSFNHVQTPKIPPDPPAESAAPAPLVAEIASAKLGCRKCDAGIEHKACDLYDKASESAAGAGKSEKKCDWPFKADCPQKDACVRAGRCLKKLPDLTKVEEVSRKIIERVATDAVHLAIVRSELTWDPDLEQTEEEIAHDATMVCTGDDMGCLPESEATLENCTHKFVEDILRSFFLVSQPPTGKCYICQATDFHSVVCNECGGIISKKVWRPVAPVSGNGPEPPAPLLDNNSFLSPLTQAACAISQLSLDSYRKKQIVSIAEAEKIIKGYGLAGAASHNGQGWKDAFEAIDAEAIAQEVFDNSPPFHGNLRCWPGTHLIATTIRQHIAKLRKAALPAPPSEANVPTSCNVNSLNRQEE